MKKETLKKRESTPEELAISVLEAKADDQRLIIYEANENLAAIKSSIELLKES